MIEINRIVNAYEDNNSYVGVKVQLGVIARCHTNLHTYSHTHAHHHDLDACSILIMCESKLT